MKVSVIVVAYNIDEYIEKCIESIINQTLKEIEIIVVNDGSTDNTQKKVKKFIERDSRIILIDQKNGGVMKAREAGYKIASGEYILFVDGDDWLKLDACEKLYLKARDIKCDIVYYKFIFKNIDGSEDYSHKYGDYINFNKIDEYEFLRNIMLSKIYPGIWNKFIRREFIEKNNININNNLRYAEDLAFCCELGIYKPKVGMLNEFLYYYYQRQNSTTRILDEKIFDINKAVLNIKDNLNIHNIYDKFYEEFEYLSFIQNYYQMIKIISKNNCIYSNELYDNWKRYKIKLRNNKYIKEKIDKESIGYKLYLKIFNFNYNLGKIYCKIRGII